MYMPVDRDLGIWLWDTDTVMDMGYEELKHVMDTCLEQNMVPALSCGMTKELIPGIREKFGNDWMANVGGAIHTHPEGIEKAVKELREVIDNG